MMYYIIQYRFDTYLLFPFKTFLVNIFCAFIRYWRFSNCFSLFMFSFIYFFMKNVYDDLVPLYFLHLNIHLHTNIGLM